MAMSWAAPSASAMSWRARLGADGREGAAGELAVDGDAGRARGQHDDGVVGRHAGIGVDAVEGLCGRRAQCRRRGPWASTTASVVSTTSIVASAGASMPAPLAMPETDQPSPAALATLCTVSVVLMAMAAAS